MNAAFSPLRLRHPPSGPTAPVIVGSLGDVHVTAVVKALGRLDCVATVVDADRLDSEGAATFDPEAAAPAEPSPRGWIRRVATPTWRLDVLPESEGGVERAAWLAWLTGWIDATDVRWLTPLRTLIRADNKLVQLAAARDLRIPAPRTIVTTRRADLRILGTEIVVKPLGPDQYVRDGVARYVAAQRISVESLIDEEMSAAPFLYQELLVAERHVRAVTVGDAAFLASLDARDLPLDWREHDPAHDSFRPHDDESIATMALELARALGVGYTSQDWVVTGSGPYFLDLNPAGQWLFLPNEVAEPITRALAERLASR